MADAQRLVSFAGSAGRAATLRVNVNKQWIVTIIIARADCHGSIQKLILNAGWRRKPADPCLQYQSPLQRYKNYQNISVQQPYDTLFVTTTTMAREHSPWLLRSSYQHSPNRRKFKNFLKPSAKLLVFRPEAQRLEVHATGHSKSLS